MTKLVLDLELTVEQWVEVEEALTTKIICIKRGEMGPGNRKEDIRWIHDLENIRKSVQHLLRRDK